jgi:hypothetical protein
MTSNWLIVCSFGCMCAPAWTVIHSRARHVPLQQLYYPLYDDAPPYSSAACLMVRAGSAQCGADTLPWPLLVRDDLPQLPAAVCRQRPSGGVL